MDMNSILKSVMSNDTISQLGKMAGIDEKDAANLLTEVMPQLIKGAKSQSKNKDTAGAFAEALMSHGEKDSSDMNGFIKNIDLNDGAKIVGHLLGTEKETATQKAAEKSGIDAKKVATLMAVVAPLVMNHLGKSAKESAKASDKNDLGSVVSGLMDGVDAGDIVNIAKMFLKK